MLDNLLDFSVEHAGPITVVVGAHAAVDALNEGSREYARADSPGLSAEERSNATLNGARNCLRGTIYFTVLSWVAGLPHLAFPETAATIGSSLPLLKARGFLPGDFKNSLVAVPATVAAAYLVCEGNHASTPIDLLGTAALSSISLGISLGGSSRLAPISRALNTVGAAGMVVSNSWNAAADFLNTGLDVGVVVEAAFAYLNASFGREQARQLWTLRRGAK